jgi:uncharacterized membrane protein YphA (DoxX/SURF4 family)
MTNLPLPIEVLYAGLAGVVLSLFVATIQNGWSLRVFFILALRLAIGWHFLFEGLVKVNSHYVGPTETNRPFTSEPYFRDADGPLAPYIRKQIGDPEELLRQKTEPASVPERVAKITDPNMRLAVGRMEAERLVTAKASSDKQIAAKAIADEQAANAEYAKAVPESVRKEWDEFARKFAEEYKLSEERKAKLDNELTPAAMAKYGKWLVGVEARDSKVKYVSGDTPLSAPQRLDYINKRKADLDELQKRPAADLGTGYGLDMARIKDMKALVSAARTILIADADAFLAELKKDAFAAILNDRLEQPAVNVVSPSKYVGKDDKNDTRLHGLITFQGANPNPFATLPPTTQDLWKNFYTAFKSAYPLTANAEANVDAAFETAKLRLVSWYTDRDEFTGKDPKPGFGRLKSDYETKQKTLAAVKKDASEAEGFHKFLLDAATRKAEEDLKASHAALLAGLDSKYGDLKALLTAALPADVVKGPAESAEKKNAYVESLDWRTRWMLVAVGACLLAGLFTPLACIVGAAFLVLTYLTHPPFPWLPLPPGTEGNPIFVNKNVIEFLGLMVVLVHPTGRWMGLDALLHRMIFRNAPDPK